MVATRLKTKKKKGQLPWVVPAARSDLRRLVRLKAEVELLRGLASGPLRTLLDADGCLTLSGCGLRIEGCPTEDNGGGVVIVRGRYPKRVLQLYPRTTAGLRHLAVHLATTITGRCHEILS